MPKANQRDLRISRDKNVAYRKHIKELQRLLTESNQKNEQLRHFVEVAKDIGADHVKMATEQTGCLHTRLRKTRKVLEAIERGFEDPTIASYDSLKRKFIETKLKALWRAVGQEVQ